MDKIKLTGRNLGRVCNSKLRHVCIRHAIAYITKWPNLKLKTRPKQLLGSLPLAFALPGFSFQNMRRWSRLKHHQHMLWHMLAPLLSPYLQELILSIIYLHFSSYRSSNRLGFEISKFLFYYFASLKVVPAVSRKWNCLFFSSYRSSNRLGFEISVRCQCSHKPFLSFVRWPKISLSIWTFQLFSGKPDIWGIGVRPGACTIKLFTTVIVAVLW